MAATDGWNPIEHRWSWILARVHLTFSRVSPSADCPSIMWRTYDAINGWIKFSDTKAGAISAADIAILATLFSKFVDYNIFIFSHQSVELFLVFSVVCGVLSIVFSTVSLCPKVNASSYKSLIFF